MIHVEPATAAMFNELWPLLEKFQNTSVPRAWWERLFIHPWPETSPLRGYVLRDDSRAIGFFGVIHSQRMIDGRLEKFANLTSWIVLPEFRNHALRLFQAVTNIPDHTLTCFTPRRETLPFYKRCGFQELETRFRILLPLPSFDVSANTRSTTNPQRIAAQLDAPLRETFKHHRFTPCKALLLSQRKGARQCLVLFTRTRGRRYAFARVHYLSDPAFFAENTDLIRLRLGLAARSLLVMIDERMLAGRSLKHCKIAEMSAPSVFRSSSLSAGQIDNLYSELVLLGL